MSKNITLTLDGFELNGSQYDTSSTSVREGFEWPSAQPQREWVEKRYGKVQAPNPRTELFEIKIPLQFEGAESDINADAGAIIAKCQKAEANAHLGGIELVASIIDDEAVSDENETTLQVIAGQLGEIQIDMKRLHGYGSAVLTLQCEPWLLGPWIEVASGRKAAGLYAQEVTVSSIAGDLPGPTRVSVKNAGSYGQQFALFGLDGRGYSAGSKLLLGAETFDYSTAPLGGTYTAGTNEVQTATKSGTISGGTYTLSYEGGTTSSLAHNAGTATVQSALEALTGLTGNVTVGGTALSSGNLSFTFGGQLAATDTSLISINSSLTGGGSVTLSETTKGIGGYVALSSLQGAWSDFMRTADQTDTGTFQLWALVSTDAAANEARVRASISVGDTSAAVINRAASVPASGAPVWVNIGPVHAKERISAGSYRWNATVSGMTVGTTGKYLRVHKLAKVPVENGVAIVRTPLDATKTLTLSDDFNQTSGNYTGKVMSLGGTVSGGGGLGGTADFTLDTATKRLKRTTAGDTAGAGRYVYAGGTVTDCAAEIDSTHSYGGLLLRYVDSNNYAYVTRDAFGLHYLYKRVGGTVTLLGSGGFGSKIVASVRSDGTWTTGNTYPASYYDADLATGGTLASGKVGIYDEYTGGTAPTRYYDNFRAWKLPAPRAAAHISRHAVWQPDGSVETEAVAGTYYAYSAGQQRAGIPLLQPDAGDDHVNRLLIASASLNPDYASDYTQPVALEYTVEHRPAYAIGRY